MDKAPFAIVSGEAFDGPQDLCLAYRELRHQLAATIAERDRAVNELAALRNNMARAADCSHQCRRCGLAYTPAADSTTEDCPACGYDGHAAIAAGGEGAGS